MTSERAPAIVLYDGACPACTAEIGLLRRWDRSARLRIVDISAPDFRVDDWGFPRSALSSELHVRRAEGGWVKGMAAIRYLYRLVGRGGLLDFTGWPQLAPLYDALYRGFARNRLLISRWLGLKPARCSSAR